MFKKTQARIRTTIESIKASFQLVINTIESLTQEVVSNTAKVEALTAEQQELRGKLDKIVEHTHYLVRAKKSELQRAGHRVE